MKLFDEIIESFLKLTKGFEKKEYFKLEDWPDTDERSMILRSDMAYELGGAMKPGYGCTLVTTNASIVPKDAVYVIGKDIKEIKEDSPYTRVALVLIDDEKMGKGEQLYSSIRGIEFTRYHFYPKGFMMRVSVSKNKETVRVSKKALGEGLTFSKAGSTMIKQFKKNPFVRAVQIYYITEEKFDYKAIEKLTIDASNRIETIDHILQTPMTDCKVCNLQEICNEVEELRELHFKKK